jgi:hypothetical protein
MQVTMEALAKSFESTSDLFTISNKQDKLMAIVEQEV